MIQNSKIYHLDHTPFFGGSVSSIANVLLDMILGLYHYRLF